MVEVGVRQILVVEVERVAADQRAEVLGGDAPVAVRVEGREEGPHGLALEPRLERAQDVGQARDAALLGQRQRQGLAV